MSEESTTPDLIELARRRVDASRETNHTDIDEARAAAERLAEERG